MEEAFPALMDADFETLLEYLERKKQPVQVSSESPEKNVCMKASRRMKSLFFSECGLVLGQVYCPDVHWLEHAVKAKEHTDMSRLNAADKTLADFLDKAGWYDLLPLHGVQERLKAMKFRSHFKRLNYTIALTCILEGYELLQEKISPFLPHSNAAWARNLTVLDPVPPAFIRTWLKSYSSPPPLEISLKHRKNESPMHCNTLMRPNFTSCMN